MLLLLLLLLHNCEHESCPNAASVASATAAVAARESIDIFVSVSGFAQRPRGAHRLNKQITPLLICTKTVISRPIFWHWIQELHSCCRFWFCPRYCCCCELSFPRSRLQWANQGRRWWWRYDVVEHGIDEHEPLGGCRGATEVFDSNHFNIKVYLHWVARDSAPCCCVAPVLRQWFDTRGPYITPSGVCEWERIDWRLSLW